MLLLLLLQKYLCMYLHIFSRLFLLLKNILYLIFIIILFMNNISLWECTLKNVVIFRENAFNEL